MEVEKLESAGIDEGSKVGQVGVSRCLVRPVLLLLSSRLIGGLVEFFLEQRF